MPNEEKIVNDQVLLDEIDEVEDVEDVETDDEDIEADEDLDLEGDSDEDEDIDLDADDTDADETDEETDDEEDEEDGESDGNSGDESDDNSNEPDEKDLKYQQLDASHSKLKANVRKTLHSLGIEVKDGEDLNEALEKAAAETEGKTLEEYRKENAEAEELEQAKAIIRKQKFEQLAAADLSDLKKSFPDLLKKTAIRDCFDSFEDFKKFGSLRDNGIAAKDAYLAVNSEKIREKQSAAARQKAANDGKTHIKSVAPKATSDGSNATMPKKTLEEWRDIFPDKSDKEIKELYRQSL